MMSKLERTPNTHQCSPVMHREGSIFYFYSSVKQGDYQAKGWPDFVEFSTYCYSKIGLTLLSFAQQREFDKDPRPDLVLNVVSMEAIVERCFYIVVFLEFTVIYIFKGRIFFLVSFAFFIDQQGPFPLYCFCILLFLYILFSLTENLLLPLELIKCTRFL